MSALAAELRSSIGASLASDGIDAEIEPRMVLDPSESPCIDIYSGSPARDTEHMAFGDQSGAHVLTVRARVTAAAEDSSQDILYDLIDDDHDLCVAAAIEADPSLDGWATEVWVDPESFSGVLDFSTGTRQLVGCTWRVLVQQAHS